MVMDVKEQIWLPNDYDCSKNFIAFARKIRLPNKEYLRNKRCERTNMAYKCRLFGAVKHFTAIIHVCTVSIIKVYLHKK